jgi:fatty-acyl-CoA synthase
LYLKEGAGVITEQDIIVHCRANMAHFKVPRTMIFGELSMTSTGKVQKFKLREEMENGRT